jgi:DNA-binding CsgD family transcriptional regulator/tetratricopeptide (TPR) repeat protein
MSLRGVTEAISDFLAAATSRPRALSLQGEPGIGKTTVWSEAVDLAVERGFHVLQTRPVESESLVSYGTLAALMASVESTVRDCLPYPQRIAMDRVLTQSEPDDLPIDPRAVGAAFLTVVETLAETRPVLIAIDDTQWVDPSSAQTVSFATRRLSGPAGVLTTVRNDSAGDNGELRLQMREPDAVVRIKLRPLSMSSLQVVLVEELDVRLPRPTLARVHETSGGNPFYAIELAKSIDVEARDSDVVVPSNLTELMCARIGDLSAEAHRLLLTAACLPAPTVELLAYAACSTPLEVIETLADAEDRGIIEIEQNRVRFAHPLLSRVVYSSTTPTCRREIHQRLAKVMHDPEVVARHRALAATEPDTETLRLVDEAAQSARMRGAPAVAAELVELTVTLGDATPDRLIRLADYHFAAGNAGRARALLKGTLDQPTSRSLRVQALSLLGFIAVLDGRAGEAKTLLEQALQEAHADPVWRPHLLIALAFAQMNIGQIDGALATVESVVTEAAERGQAQSLSGFLGARTLLRFINGAGVDDNALQRALRVEDREAGVPLHFRPRLVNALLLAYTGELDRAHLEIREVRRRCIANGEEGELVAVGFNSVIIEIWRGDFAEASLLAEDVAERALGLDGAYPTFIAHTCRAVLAAYTGRVDEARRNVADALAMPQTGDYLASSWPATALGFLELSLGNYSAALTILRPLLSEFEASGRGMEIVSASFVPDAVEAMIGLNYLAEAEPLVDMLEREGRRLDRPWLLAVGARCRGMLFAARGDVDAAGVAIERAVAAHRRLAMPFELARTQLILGQVQRRRRQRNAATTALHAALRTFEELDTPLWADQVRAILDRTTVRPPRRALNPSEQQVAELVTTGMTNRDVAAALSISPKTVEACLSRVYRKLEIRSRAELGRHLFRTAASARDDVGA